MIAQGRLSGTAATQIKLKFLTYNADLNVKGLNFTEYTFIDSTTNALFFPNLGPYRWLNISDCSFRLE